MIGTVRTKSSVVAIGGRTITGTVAVGESIAKGDFITITDGAISYCVVDVPHGIAAQDGEAGQTIKVYIPNESPEYNILYNLDGGVLAEAPSGTQTITYDDLPYTLPIPTKAGYIFEGWYTDAQFANKIEVANDEDFVDEVLP